MHITKHVKLEYGLCTLVEVSVADDAHVCSLSHVQLFATPWTVTGQTPLSMEFSRQEDWSGLPHPPPGDLPDPGIESQPPALEADSLPKRSLGTRQGDHLAGHTYSFLCSFTYRPEFSPKVIESCQITQILVSPRVVYFPVAY